MAPNTGINSSKHDASPLSICAHSWHTMVIPMTNVRHISDISQVIPGIYLSSPRACQAYLRYMSDMTWDRWQIMITCDHQPGICLTFSGMSLGMSDILRVLVMLKSHNFLLVISENLRELQIIILHLAVSPGIPWYPVTCRDISADSRYALVPWSLYQHISLITTIDSRRQRKRCCSGLRLGVRAVATNWGQHCSSVVLDCEQRWSTMLNVDRSWSVMVNVDQECSEMLGSWKGQCFSIRGLGCSDIAHGMHSRMVLVCLGMSTFLNAQTDTWQLPDNVWEWSGIALTLPR